MVKPLRHGDSHRVKVAQELSVSEVYIFLVQERLMRNTKMQKHF